MDNQLKSEKQNIDVSDETLALDSAPSRSKKLLAEKRPMPIIRYLIYLLILTVTVTGVSLSRYSTTSAFKGDSARVADFDVEVTHDYWNFGQNIDIDSVFNLPSGREYVFTVTNHSEVAVRARLIIENCNLAPSSISPSDAGGSPTQSGWISLAVNSAPQEIRVRFYAAAIVPGGNNVQMHVEYEQID